MRPRPAGRGARGGILDGALRSVGGDGAGGGGGGSGSRLRQAQGWSSCPPPPGRWKGVVPASSPCPSRLAPSDKSKDSGLPAASPSRKVAVATADHTRHTSAGSRQGASHGTNVRPPSGGQSLSPGCRQGWILLETPREAPFHALPASGALGIPGLPRLVAASLPSLPPSSRASSLCVPLRPLPSF